MSRKKNKNLHEDNKNNISPKKRKQFHKIKITRKKRRGVIMAFLFSISDFFLKLIKHSFLRFIFSDLYVKVNEKWKNGYIYRKIRTSNKKARTNSRIIRVFEQGYTNQRISTLSRKIIHYKLKVVGVGVFFFALATGIASIAKLYARTTTLDYEIRNFVVAAIMLFISFMYILSKREFGETLLSHKFSRYMITNVLNLNATIFERSDSASEGSYFVVAFLSICLGLLTFFVDVLLMMGLIALIIALLIIVTFPEIGVLMLIALIPFASLLNHPTTFTLLFISFCMLGFFTKFLLGKRVLKFEVFDVLILIMGLLLFFGGIFSKGEGSWKSADIYIAFLGMYFLIVNMYVKKAGIYRGFKAIITIGFVVALIGIAEGVLFRGTKDLASILAVDKFPYITSRVSSLLGNPNTLGVYLLLVYPIALAQLKVSRKKKVKLYYFMALCSIVICSIMTWSRGTWVGMIVATMVFLLMYNFRTIWIFIFGGALTPALIMLYQKLVVFIDFENPIISRFISIFNFNNPDTSMAFRPTIWWETWEIISANWLTGIGVGESAFRTEFFNHATSDLLWAAHSHSLYLQIFLELGIVGLIVFAIILVAYLQKCFSNVKERNQKSRTRTMICGGYASIFGLCVMGFVDHVWYNHRVFLMSWIIIALTIALTKISEAELESAKIANNMRSVDIEVG